MKLLKYGILLCAAIIFLNVCTGVNTKNCTCQNPEWCKPIATPFAKTEVFIFTIGTTNYKLYDWDRITTIAIFEDSIDPTVVCFAHSKGIRVVYKGDFPSANLTSQSDRYLWVQKQVNYIQTNNLDGINVDFEQAISKTDQVTRDGLSLLMWELHGALKMISSFYQITFDTPYFPETESGRVFDYLEISKAVDFIVIMAYDMSNSFEKANCNLTMVQHGISQFVSTGIPLTKLVLALPWYGYHYECAKLEGNTCIGPSARSQVDYSYITELYFPEAIGGRQFDQTSYSPYFNYKNEKIKKMNQIWYDDPQSLSYKCQFAVKTNMRGVGVWRVDAADYGNNSTVRNLTTAMWNSLPKVHLYNLYH